ncbi:aminopeptidase P family protein [Candidatus Woesearchaeota archaeon]|nr:MAG: aminopeptidase P family protein [Candidatus Woesearchaeota archaeon]
MKVKSGFDRLRDVMRKNNLDWVVLLRYVYNSEPLMDYLLEQNTDESLLLVTKRKAFLFASPLVIDALKCRNDVILVSCRSVMEELGRMASRMKKKPRIGVASARIPLSFSKRLGRIGRIVSVDEELDSVREIKEAREVSLLRKAAATTEEILSKCFLNFRLFRKETDVKKFLVEEASVFGGTAFEPIVASGRNSRIPHARALNKPLAPGFCIIDFGVKYKGYHADISRTVYLKKNKNGPSQRELESFRKVIEARDSSFSAIRVGAKASEVDDRARKILGEKLVHSLGHGVGVEIHEKPFLRPGSKDVIREGSVFTLEPAVYEKSFGIRVEDMVFVGEKGAEFISGPQRTLLLLNIK